MATVVGHWHLRGYGMWGVEEIATKKLVARVGYHCPEGWPEYELRWTIGRAFWGKGFATEAARAALDYTFDVMKRDHIISLIDPDNVRSIAVAERLGEKLEGEMEVGGYRLFVYGISRMTRTPETSLNVTKSARSRSWSITLLSNCHAQMGGARLSRSP